MGLCLPATRGSYGHRQDVIGTLPGVDRPALAALIPTRGSRPDASARCGSEFRVQTGASGPVRNHGRRLFPGSSRNKQADSGIDEHRRRGSTRATTSQRSFSFASGPFKLELCRNVEGRDVFTGSVDVIVY